MVIVVKIALLLALMGIGALVLKRLFPPTENDVRQTERYAEEFKEQHDNDERIL